MHPSRHTDGHGSTVASIKTVPINRLVRRLEALPLSRSHALSAPLTARHNDSNPTTTSSSSAAVHQAASRSAFTDHFAVRTNNHQASSVQAAGNNAQHISNLVQFTTQRSINTLSFNSIRFISVQFNQPHASTSDLAPPDNSCEHRPRRHAGPASKRTIPIRRKRLRLFASVD